MMNVKDMMNKNYNDLLRSFVEWITALNKTVKKITIDVDEDPTRKPIGTWKIAHSFTTAIEKTTESIWIKIGNGNVFGYYYK